jgi:hypothetical protein
MRATLALFLGVGAAAALAIIPGARTGAAVSNTAQTVLDGSAGVGNNSAT